MEYKVILDNIYEGPIAALYELVRASKIDICDIPIARITEQYLEYLRYLQSVDIEVGAEFILMAATLMHIKSEELLPRSDKPDPGRERDDPRRELIEKLLEYQKFKEAAHVLEDKGRARADLIFREKKQGLLDYSDEGNWTDISIYDLLNAFSDVVEFVEEPVFYQMEPESVTVAMKINLIMDRLNAGEKLFFGEMFSERITRLEVVITFLAVLELVKSGSVRIQQHKLFGDIRIIKA